MEIETIQENEKQNSPKKGVYEIELKVGDGFRFGFGFGLGSFIWGVLLTGVIICGIYIYAELVMANNPLTQKSENSLNVGSENQKSKSMYITQPSQSDLEKMLKLNNGK
jgi:hypothetical protein